MYVLEVDRKRLFKSFLHNPLQIIVRLQQPGFLLLFVFAEANHITLSKNA